MADPNSPLSEQHFQQIQQALDAIQVAEQQIALAQRAGIDMGQQAATLQASKQQLLQVKQVYFPGR